jgi:uncharacterized protein YlaI
MSEVALIDRCNVCQKEFEINLTALDWKLIEAAIREKHTCPDCKVRKTRLRALPITEHGPPDCLLRLAEINSPEKKQEHFAFLRLMNKFMGED